MGPTRLVFKETDNICLNFNTEAVYKALLWQSAFFGKFVSVHALCIFCGIFSSSFYGSKSCQLFYNILSVAGAVLKPPLSLLNWFIESSFRSESSWHCLSQTVRAGELTFWENVHPPHMSHFIFLFNQVVELVVWVSTPSWFYCQCNRHANWVNDWMVQNLHYFPDFKKNSSVFRNF